MKLWNPRKRPIQPYLQFLSAAGMGGEENFLGRFPRCFQLRSEGHETDFHAGLHPLPAFAAYTLLGVCVLIYSALTRTYYVLGTGLEAELTEMPSS